MVQRLTNTNAINMIEEIMKSIEALAVEFPVRESEEFDEGRRSMKREVLEILGKYNV